MDPQEPTGQISSGYRVQRTPMEIRILLLKDQTTYGKFQQRWVEFSEKDGYKEEWLDVPQVTEP